MKRLKELRQLKGESQTDVANHLQITRQAYNNYENGLREPNNEMLLKLADYYGVSTDYLLGRTDSPFEKPGIPDVPDEFLFDLRDADTSMIYELWNYLHYLNMKKDGILKGDAAGK